MPRRWSLMLSGIQNTDKEKSIILILPTANHVVKVKPHFLIFNGGLKLHIICIVFMGKAQLFPCVQDTILNSHIFFHISASVSVLC